MIAEKSNEKFEIDGNWRQFKYIAWSLCSGSIVHASRINAIADCRELTEWIMLTTDLLCSNLIFGHLFRSFRIVNERTIFHKWTEANLVRFKHITDRKYIQTDEASTNTQKYLIHSHDVGQSFPSSPKQRQQVNDYRKINLALQWALEWHCHDVRCSQWNGVSILGYLYSSHRIAAIRISIWCRCYR